MQLPPIPTIVYMNIIDLYKEITQKNVSLENIRDVAKQCLEEIAKQHHKLTTPQTARFTLLKNQFQIAYQLEVSKEEDKEFEECVDETASTAMQEKKIPEELKPSKQPGIIGKVASWVFGGTKKEETPEEKKLREDMEAYSGYEVEPEKSLLGKAWEAVTDVVGFGAGAAAAVGEIFTTEVKSTGKEVLENVKKLPQDIEKAVLSEVHHLLDRAEDVQSKIDVLAGRLPEGPIKKNACECAAIVGGFSVLYLKDQGSLDKEDAVRKDTNIDAFYNDPEKKQKNFVGRLVSELVSPGEPEARFKKLLEHNVLKAFVNMNDTLSKKQQEDPEALVKLLDAVLGNILQAPKAPQAGTTSKPPTPPRDRFSEELTKLTLKLGFPNESKDLELPSLADWLKNDTLRNTLITLGIVSKEQSDVLNLDTKVRDLVYSGILKGTLEAIFGSIYDKFIANGRAEAQIKQLLYKQICLQCGLLTSTEEQAPVRHEEATTTEPPVSPLPSTPTELSPELLQSLTEKTKIFIEKIIPESAPNVRSIVLGQAPTIAKIIAKNGASIKLQDIVGILAKTIGGILKAPQEGTKEWTEWNDFWFPKKEEALKKVVEEEKTQLVTAKNESVSFLQIILTKLKLGFLARALVVSKEDKSLWGEFKRELADTLSSILKLLGIGDYLAAHMVENADPLISKALNPETVADLPTALSSVLTPSEPPTET